MKLAGKTVIVTGGGRDIGAAAAKKLSSEGANVAISYFESSKGADTVVSEIKSANGKAIAIQADLNTQEGVDALVNETLAVFGSIDILVNNAGGLVARKTMAEMDLAHWNTVMTLNLSSTFMMTKACLEHIKSGTIVNLASQAGRDGGGPGSLAYATSKGAVMTMTRGLAKEIGPDVRVNAICPCMVDTDFHNIHTPDAGRRGFEANAPVRSKGHVDDVANLVLFLASDDSAFMTGANIDINGGMLFS